jgi:hypothetical protein
VWGKVRAWQRVAISILVELCLVLWLGLVRLGVTVGGCVFIAGVGRLFLCCSLLRGDLSK